jgi:hypothetical protein
MLWIKNKKSLGIGRPMIAILLVCGASQAQDSPSLGDLARQQRQQKEQAKTTPGKTPKVITNELMPRHAATETAVPETTSPKDDALPVASETGTKRPAESWKAQIQAEKNQIAGGASRGTERVDSFRPRQLRRELRDVE